jgi:hypothetical protein
MKTVVVCDIYGLGGIALSPGMLTLAEKIKWLGGNFLVLGPYNQREWETAAVDLAKRPASDVLGVIGYSLGANNAVQLAARLHRKVDYLAGIQASYWGMGVSWSGAIMLPPNVGYALGIYNPIFISTFGLGYARFAAPPGYRGNLRLVTNRDLHWDVDNDTGIHGLILRELKRLGDSA